MRSFMAYLVLLGTFMLGKQPELSGRASNAGDNPNHRGFSSAEGGLSPVDPNKVSPTRSR